MRSQSEIQMLSRGIARNGSRKSQDLEVLPNNLPSTSGQAHWGAGGRGGGVLPYKSGLNRYVLLNRVWFSGS